MTITRELLERDEKRFFSRFGGSGSLSWVSAPGRVNLIGEHTDYHDGFVLPAAIDRHVWLLGRGRDDSKVRIHSETFNEDVEFDLDEPMSDSGGWSRRAEGIIRMVVEKTKEVHGMEIWLDADLPVGGGLSSSAASMAAIGIFAADRNGILLMINDFARMLQEAEHRYAGLQCGIMDQLAVLQGKKRHALLLDCRSLEQRHVSIPEGWDLVVLDTKVKHDLASSEYNRRQIECAAVLDEIRKLHPEVAALRDADIHNLEEVEAISDPTGIRRCRHVITENERVHLAVEALKTGDKHGVGRLFAQSHISLRDDYEVSCNELDAMFESAIDAPGCIGVRMTGGGFGGSCVALVAKDKVVEFAKVAISGYKSATGIDGEAIITEAADCIASGIMSV